MHSAYAYQMVEFFLKENHLQKQTMYDKAIEQFYLGFKDLNISFETADIPYKETFLHTLRFSAKNEEKIIVVCGGCDSFVEESL